MRNDVWIFTANTIPSHTRSTPKNTAGGTMSGTMMNAISKKSIKNPSTKTTRFTTMRKPKAPPGMPVKALSIQRSPSRPRNTRAKVVEPIRRKTTMIVRRLVSSIANLSADIVSDRLAIARSIAPTAPSAPASVGVAIPAKMLPRTTTMRISGGRSDSTTCLANSIPVERMCSGRAGATSLLKKARMAT